METVEVTFVRFTLLSLGAKGDMKAMDSEGRWDAEEMELTNWWFSSISPSSPPQQNYLFLSDGHKYSVEKCL